MSDVVLYVIPDSLNYLIFKYYNNEKFDLIKNVCALNFFKSLKTLNY